MKDHCVGSFTRAKWDSKENKCEAERLMKESWPRADELDEEAEEMLHRLIRIRGYLWT